MSTPAHPLRSNSVVLCALATCVVASLSFSAHARSRSRLTTQRSSVVMQKDDPPQINQNAAPAPTLRSQLMRVDAGLSGTELMQRTRLRLPAMRVCYQRAGFPAPPLPGMVELRVALNTRGTITLVTATPSSPAYQSVAVCIRDAVRTLRFSPRAQDGLSFVMRVNFETPSPYPPQ